jgi:radical SAM superfamily enzyme YgiQ (UPF0313 family)
MKILLLNLCIRSDTPKKIYPVGLGYIASAVSRAGYQSEILDIDLHRYSDSQLEEILRAKDFDVVGMGCIVTGYAVVKKICRLLREINKNCVIIIGNSVASSIPEILLSRTQADIAVIGEGDITIVETLNALRDNLALDRVEGIYFKRNGSIVATPRRAVIANIDDIPLPGWELFDTGRYLEESKNYVSEPYPIAKDQIRAFPLNTARGCIYKCTFCYHVFRDNKYRFRSVASIVKEIKELKRRFAVNYINFWDELTIFSRKQAQGLARGIMEAGLDIFWSGTCRADLFKEAQDLEIAREMKKSGCVGLSYSLESANTEILKSMNKLIDKEDFLRQKRIFDQAGIVSWTSLVFGYPQETEETIKETMELCYENDIYPSIGYLLPQPGTVMYQYLLEKRIVKDEEEYLLNMGDRQDLRFNLTGIPDERFQGLVKDYLKKINLKLNLNISEDNLIKTGHYKARAA